ncbi:MAG TPA: type II toxin-antitoxin system RelE/ParE family toxin [Acidobacteriota bacterium]
MTRRSWRLPKSRGHTRQSPYKAKIKDLFRIRGGDYRIVYQVRDVLLIVLVIRIGHRREIYRGL